MSDSFEPTKKVLFISYHYPPIAVSSGYQRTLAFSKYLNQFGWDVSVLTVSNKAYEKWNPDNVSMIPAHVRVIKAFGRDTQRHLSIKGRYLRAMALPDKWQSWIFGGIISGLMEISRNRPDAIVSTYPIASAHVIGYWLHRLTGIPWIADMRDPMAQDDYPADPVVYKSFLGIEKKIFRYAARVVFVTEGARDYYLRRYPEVSPEKMTVIHNGYDEEIFSQLDGGGEHNESSDGPLKLVHAGIIYPKERDPSQFFEAIKELKREGRISSASLNVVLRATGHDQIYSPVLKHAGIQDIVDLAQSVPYSEALKEMLNADGLLLLQAENCNDQIPAKAYEYIRANRPVVALTSPVGETGKLINKTGAGVVAALDDKEAIKKAICNLMDGSIRSSLSPELVASFSRKNKAGELAELLDDVC